MRRNSIFQMNRRTFILTATASSISACGGGGNDSNAPPALASTNGLGSETENSNPSTPTHYADTNPIPSIIDGYIEGHSFAPGNTAKLYLNAAYAGVGQVRLFDILGKEVHRVRASVSPQVVGTAQPWLEGYGYSNPTTVTIPAIPSGVYFWEGGFGALSKPQPMYHQKFW